MGQRGFGLSAVLFILGLFVVLAAFINSSPYLKQAAQQFSTTRDKEANEPNEDQLSMYTLPSDVLAALNKSKSSGEPVLGIRTDGPSYHIPILMYHYVEHVKNPKDSVRISLNIPPEILEKQLQTLIGSNYTFITASDLSDILDGIKQPPPKPVVLTFDDGYRDFYTDAFPLLKKYNVKAVAYIISGFINQPNNLTDSQLAEIAKSGLIEIGAHTINHLALSGLSASRVREEIEGSKISLEQRLNIPITAFAYPYGSFNLQAIQLVKEAGFRSAVSTIPGKQLDNSARFFAYRVRPGYSSGRALLNLLQ